MLKSASGKKAACRRMHGAIAQGQRYQRGDKRNQHGTVHELGGSAASDELQDFIHRSTHPAGLTGRSAFSLFPFGGSFTFFLQEARNEQKALQLQAIQLEQENRALTEQIAELGTMDSIKCIASLKLGLVDPDSQFFYPSSDTIPD